MITDRAGLRAEVQGDLEALGYAGKTATQVLALLTNKTQSRPRLPVSGQEIIAQLDTAELDEMADAMVFKLLDFLASQQTVDLQDPNVTGILKKIFPTGPTRTALIAFKDEAISRLEEISISGEPTLHQVEVANG